MKRLTLFLPLPLFFAVVTVLVIVSGSSQQNKRSVVHRPKVFDESRFPIADYSADETNPLERAKRQARGKKYDKSPWRVYPHALSDSMVRVDSVDTNLPALPFEQSSAVVVGQITDARAYLSNDKTGVYSVFAIQVNEVLKNSTNTPITTASVIEAERDGGRVRFPNGRLHMYSISEHDMPAVGLRYVLFLNSNELSFQILTGYELREGKVYPLDHLPKLQIYENTDETSFLNELRAKIR